MAYEEVVSSLRRRGILKLELLAYEEVLYNLATGGIRRRLFMQSNCWHTKKYEEVP